jgi:hypothetical protein
MKTLPPRKNFNQLKQGTKEEVIKMLDFYQNIFDGVSSEIERLQRKKFTVANNILDLKEKLEELEKGKK